MVGRYAIFGELAAGGMASVHLGRLLGPAGFSRTVAIKRLHPMFAKDPEFLAMLLDEARLASRIQHPNVVSTLDVVVAPGEVLVVMEYVQGESLARLARACGKEGIALEVVSAIMTGALDGLQAAHMAKSASGEALEIVHRDISPQNILVGTDGVARVADFGVAKAARRVSHTDSGQIKGKISYMAPEQLTRDDVDGRADVFAAGAVLWELVTRKRLFVGTDPARVMHRVLYEPIPAPSEINPDVPSGLDEVVMGALQRDREQRFASAEAMALALERVIPPAPRRAVADWVERTASESLRQRGQLLEEVERQEATVTFDSATDLARAIGLEHTASTTSLLFDESEPESSRVRTLLASSAPTSLPALNPAQPNTPSRVGELVAKEPRQRAVVAGVVLGCICFAGVGIVVYSARGEPEAPPTLDRGGYMVAVPAARVTPPTPDSSAAEASASAPAPLTAVAPAVRPKVLPTPKLAHKPPAPAGNANCSPPYVLLPGGIKRFKSECLGK